MAKVELKQPVVQAIAEDIKDAASAVSYTHLDVYKRQVWECKAQNNPQAS